VFLALNTLAEGRSAIRRPDTIVFQRGSRQQVDTGPGIPDATIPAGALEFVIDRRLASIQIS